MDTKKATNKATSSSLLKPDVPIIIDPKCEFGLRDTILSQKGLRKLQETEAYISAHHALLRQDISAYNLLVNTLVAEPDQPPLKKAKYTGTKMTKEIIQECVCVTLNNRGFKGKEYSPEFIVGYSAFYKKKQVNTCKDIIRIRDGCMLKLRNIAFMYEKRFTMAEMVRDLWAVHSMNPEKNGILGMFDEKKNTSLPELCKTLVKGMMIPVRKTLYKVGEEDLKAHWKGDSGRKYSVEILAIGTNRKGEDTYHLEYADGDIDKNADGKSIHDPIDGVRVVKPGDFYNAQIKDIRYNHDGTVYSLRVTSFDPSESGEWIHVNSLRLGKHRIQSTDFTYDNAVAPSEETDEYDE